MLTALQFNPTQGATSNVNVIYEEGYIEIINESRFTLSIGGLPGGSVTQPGNTAYLFPITQGGALLSILAIRSSTLGQFVDLDRGPLNQVTVNMYRPNEIVGMNYPFFLTRQVQIANIHNMVTDSINNSSVANSQTLTLPVVGIFPAQETWCWGFDISMSATGTATNMSVTLNNVLRPTGIVFNFRSQTSSEVNIFYRLPQAYVSVDNTQDITLTYPGFAGAGTGTISLVLHGFQQ